jgi:RNA recognition motif-containing protein
LEAKFDMTKQIAVSNLPGTATEADIETLFADYGRIQRIKFIGAGRFRVAYVDLIDARQADAALTGLEGARMGTRTLNVNEARPRQE